MKETPQEARARLLAARHGGSKLLFLFDFDGTLAPIVEHPSLAQLPMRTREVLKRLAALPASHVGILSGRSLDDLEPKVQMPELFYGGMAGLELKVAGKHIAVILGDDERRDLQLAIQQVQELAAGYPGAWVETKPAALTVHYREVAFDHAEQVHRAAREVLARFQGRFKVMDGPRAVEAILAVGRDKGESVRWLISHLGGSVFPICAGDSENDQPSLAVALETGGLALGVGPTAPAEAHCRFAGPDDLMSWLESLLPELG
jgi:trehalose-phosphatase